MREWMKRTAELAVMALMVEVILFLHFAAYHIYSYKPLRQILTYHLARLVEGW